MNEQIAALLEQIKDATEAYSEAEDYVHHLVVDRGLSPRDSEVQSAKAESSELWHVLQDLKNQHLLLRQEVKYGGRS